MLESHPQSTDSRGLLARCVEEAISCARSCTACADACLGEADINALRRCIRLNLDCADVCDATARVLSRQTADEAGVGRILLAACIGACRLCAEECARHEHHEHCLICADACRRCAAACQEAAAVAGGSLG
jgi:hypothetical protein